jgi:hypothetical protein
MMIYLKTKTSDLSTYALRRIVGEVIFWCEKSMGTKRKSRKLSYKVTSKPYIFPAYGVYDPRTNKITIHLSECDSVRMIIKTVIHEYTHFLQDLRSYKRVLKEVGYDSHPQEVEARENERLYSTCWKLIKTSL